MSKTKFPAHIRVAIVVCSTILLGGCGLRPPPFVLEGKFVTQEGIKVDVSAWPIEARGASRSWMALVTNDSAALGGTPHCTLEIKNENRLTQHQFTFHERIDRVWTIDSDLDPEPDLMVGFVTRSAAVIRFYRGLGDSLVSTYVLPESRFAERGAKVWDVAFGHASCELRDSLGLPLVLVNLQSDYGLQPRGFVVINPRTGEEVSHFWAPVKLAPPRVGYLIQDVNHDGEVDVVYASYAVANRATVDGRDDRSAYLEAVSVSGERIWTARLRGAGSGYQFVPVPNGSEPVQDIIVLSYAGKSHGSATHLLRISLARGDTIAAIELRHDRRNFEFLVRGPSDSSESFSVFVGGEECIDEYDGNLRWLGSVRGVDPIHATDDFTGDGQRDYLVATSGNGRMITDLSFRPIAKLPDGHSLQFVRTKSKEWNYVWTVSDDRIFWQLEFRRNPNYEHWWLRVVGSVLLSIGGAYLLIRLVRQLVIYRRALKAERDLRREAEIVRTLADNIRHKMKGAVAAMMQTVGFLTEETSTDDGHSRESTAYHVTTLKGSHARILDLMHQLNSAAKILEPSVIESVHLPEFIRHLVNSEAPARLNISVEFDCNPDVSTILTDRRILTVILENLVGNAYEAMPTGGTLKITVTAEHSTIRKSRNRVVVWRVTDTGRGISPEIQEKVFNLGFTTSQEGTGMGLWLVQRAVEHLKGRIELFSLPGQGTTFVVSLPIIEQEVVDE